MNTKMLSSLPALAIAFALAGCAATPPTKELLSARDAYNAAAKGPAASLEPDRLLTAKQELDKAEAAHKDDAGSAREQHLAYLALRSSETASVYGQIALDKKEQEAANAEYAKTQDMLRSSAEKQLGETQKVVQEQSKELAAERAARQKLEASLRAALDSLKEMAMVKEESRGLVITLNGSVLFATNKSELLPAAKERLNEVAKALKDLKPGQTITIEGHTDSVGADDANMKLSQARADSVRSYLVSQGVPQDIVKAMGKGEGVPVADNNSAEGRANNRRVEIVISPEPGKAKASN